MPTSRTNFTCCATSLKQQEGATIRVQEQLDALGDLLGDPKTGFGALVFFQLRALWKTCHQQLSTFAADLTRQQEARETAKHKADLEAAKNSRLADVDQRLRGAAAAADNQRRHLAEAQNEIGRLTAFWHYFKRRRRQKSLESLRSQVVVADAAVGDLHAERSAIEHEAGARISRHLTGGPPQHQSRHHQLCGIAVRKRRMPMVWRRAPRRRSRAAFTR